MRIMLIVFALTAGGDVHFMLPPDIHSSWESCHMSKTALEMSEFSRYGGRELDAPDWQAMCVELGSVSVSL